MEGAAILLPLPLREGGGGGVSVGFFGILCRARRDDEPRQLARGPDVHRLGEIHRLVQRARLDGDRRPAALALMPDARAAGWAESAAHAAPAVGRAGPEARRAADQ